MTARARKYFKFKLAISFIRKHFNGEYLDCKNGEKLYPITSDCGMYHAFPIDKLGFIIGRTKPDSYREILPMPDYPKGSFQGFKIKMPEYFDPVMMQSLNLIYSQPQL